MIIVLITYTADVLPHRDAHIAWLREALADGVLVTAGRMPAGGGVLIAKGGRAEIEAWAERDPYRLAGVTANAYVEFTPSMAAPGLESLLP